VTHEREKAITPAEAAAYWEANAEAWTRHSRAGYDVYRDALNTPAFLAMLPSVSGLLGLDIGCGEGSNTRELARLGASMHAVDVAPTFIRHALATERADPRGILFHVADAVSLPFADDAFDFVTAFMALMDIPDQAHALEEAARVLRPGGAFCSSRSVIRVLIRRTAGCCGRRMARREPSRWRGILMRPKGGWTLGGSERCLARNAHGSPLSGPRDSIEH